MFSSEFQTNHTQSFVSISDPFTAYKSSEFISNTNVSGKGMGWNVEAVINRIKGGSKGDRLIGKRGSDRILGNGGADLLRGRGGNDTLLGGVDADWMSGDGGNDSLFGDAGNDILLGKGGNDVLDGGAGKDLLTGGGGVDTFMLGVGKGGSSVETADVIKDFTDGQDKLAVKGGLTFAQLTIAAGTGAYAGSTVITNKSTGEFLFVLQGVNNSSIDASDFVSGSTSTPTGSNALLSIANSVSAKFSPSDSQTAIAAQNGAKITIGTQTIYIGTQQVTSINQNPIIASFDSSNPAKNWVKTNYEATGADGRGYGLFWDGANLYGVFSVDGTQGTPDQDFRRAATSATQSWLRSYGQGGGAKIAVLAQINLQTGELVGAAHISARLSNGNSNSLVITGLSLNSNGNLTVQAQSWFAPRRPDGSQMMQITSGSSPFNYTLEITRDLKTVVNTSAIGWS